jgi:hypothetical protein
MKHLLGEIMQRSILTVLLLACAVASAQTPAPALPQSDKGRFAVFASSGQIVGVQYYFAAPYARAPRCFVYGDHAVIENVDKYYVQILTPVGAKVEFLCEERK